MADDCEIQSDLSMDELVSESNDISFAFPEKIYSFVSFIFPFFNVKILIWSKFDFWSFRSYIIIMFFVLDEDTLTDIKIALQILYVHVYLVKSVSLKSTRFVRVTESLEPESMT